jgi:hypothetical protein
MNIEEMKKNAKKFVNNNREEIKSMLICSGVIIGCELGCYYLGLKRGAKIQKAKDLTEMLDFIDQTESKLKEMNTHFLDVDKPVTIVPIFSHGTGQVGLNISGKGIADNDVTFTMVNDKKSTIDFAKELIEFADKATC